MGNICRSPAGEAVMRHIVESEGLADQIECDSAGTISYHTGEPPDHRMHAAAQNRGVITGGQARQINQADYNDFDLILTMDEDNYQNVLNKAPGGDYSAEIKRFCDFVTESNAKEVPDPYYGGAKGFDTVLDVVEDGCASLLENIRGQIGQ